MKEKKTKKAAKKNGGYSRIQSFCDALKSSKGKGQVKDLIATADKLYVAKGGKNNLTESKAVTGFGLRLLEGMGLLRLDGEDFFRVN